MKIYIFYVFEYNLKSILAGFEFAKTEFPLEWDYKKIIQNCWEVYENPMSIEKSVNGGKFAREGLVDDCKIQIILKKYENTCNLITARPIA